MMLSDCRVLIAEDEAFVACDLACAVEAAHGQVIGPFATVQEGLVYLAHCDVHAAILDVHLADRDIGPLAIALLDRGSIVVFHTSSDVPQEVTDRHGPQSVCSKPQASDRVVWDLAKAMKRCF
jgi:DNA-binding NarL/FixJ family response regulator